MSSCLYAARLTRVDFEDGSGVILAASRIHIADRSGYARSPGGVIFKTKVL